MLVATALEDDHTLILLGLSAENIKRLKQGQPIKVTRESHGPTVPEHLTLLIVYGKTEAAIEAELRASGAIRTTH